MAQFTYRIGIHSILRFVVSFTAFSTERLNVDYTGSIHYILFRFCKTLILDNILILFVFNHGSGRGLLYKLCYDGCNDILYEGDIISMIHVHPCPYPYNICIFMIVDYEKFKIS